MKKATLTKESSPIIEINTRHRSRGILGLNTKHLLSSNFYIEHFIKE